MNHIVNTLFSSHECRSDEQKEIQQEDIPLFIIEELIKAASTLKTRKAPGPNGIPEEVLKVLTRSCSLMFLNMYNKCPLEGIFPKRWKVQRLVLLDKGKGNPSEPSSYRPLYLLDSAKKLFKKLIKPRLQKAIAGAGGLSNNQFGFMKGRSTIDAIQKVIS